MTTDAGHLLEKLVNLVFSEEQGEAIVAAVRHVRTPEGADFYGQPIGAVIVPDVYLPSGSSAAKDLNKGDYFKSGGKTYRAESNPANVSQPQKGDVSIIDVIDVDNADAGKGTITVPQGQPTQKFQRVKQGTKAVLPGGDSGPKASLSEDKSKVGGEGPWYESPDGKGYTAQPERAKKDESGKPVLAPGYSKKQAEAADQQQAKQKPLKEMSESELKAQMQIERGQNGDADRLTQLRMELEGRKKPRREGEFEGAKRAESAQARRIKEGKQPVVPRERTAGPGELPPEKPSRAAAAARVEQMRVHYANMDDDDLTDEYQDLVPDRDLSDANEDRVSMIEHELDNRGLSRSAARRGKVHDKPTLEERATKEKELPVQTEVDPVEDIINEVGTEGMSKVEIKDLRNDISVQLSQGATRQNIINEIGDRRDEEDYWAAAGTDADMEEAADREHEALMESPRMQQKPSEAEFGQARKAAEGPGPETTSNREADDLMRAVEMGELDEGDLSERQIQLLEKRDQEVRDRARREREAKPQPEVTDEDFRSAPPGKAANEPQNQVIKLSPAQAHELRGKLVRNKLAKEGITVHDDGNITFTDRLKAQRALEAMANDKDKYNTGTRSSFRSLAKKISGAPATRFTTPATPRSKGGRRSAPKHMSREQIDSELHELRGDLKGKRGNNRKKIENRIKRLENEKRKIDLESKQSDAGLDEGTGRETPEGRLEDDVTQLMDQDPTLTEDQARAEVLLDRIHDTDAGQLSDDELRQVLESSNRRTQPEDDLARSQARDALADREAEKTPDLAEGYSIMESYDSGWDIFDSDGKKVGNEPTEAEAAAKTFDLAGGGKAPSEVLTDLGPLDNQSEDTLKRRLSQLHEKKFSDLTDPEHIEIAAIASELEKRDRRKRQDDEAKRQAVIERTQASMKEKREKAAEEAKPKPGQPQMYRGGGADGPGDWTVVDGDGNKQTFNSERKAQNYYNSLVEKSKTPSAPAGAPKAFVKDKQKKFGTVNPDAKGNDPERREPKMTMADGLMPEPNMRVVHKDGRTGRMVDTWQNSGSIVWDDGGKAKSVSYRQLNALEGGSAPPAKGPVRTPENSMPGNRYPIDNAKDLSNAIKRRNMNRNKTSDLADVDAHIKGRAEALGLPDPSSKLLPKKGEEEGTGRETPEGRFQDDVTQLMDQDPTLTEDEAKLEVAQRMAKEVARSEAEQPDKAYRTEFAPSPANTNTLDRPAKRGDKVLVNWGTPSSDKNLAPGTVVKTGKRKGKPYMVVNDQNQTGMFWPEGDPNGGKPEVVMVRSPDSLTAKSGTGHHWIETNWQGGNNTAAFQSTIKKWDEHDFNEFFNYADQQDEKELKFGGAENPKVEAEWWQTMRDLAQAEVDRRGLKIKERSGPGAPSSGKQIESAPTVARDKPKPSDIMSPAQSRDASSFETAQWQYILEGNEHMGASGGPLYNMDDAEITRWTKQRMDEIDRLQKALKERIDWRPEDKRYARDGIQKERRRIKVAKALLAWRKKQGKA